MSAASSPDFLTEFVEGWAQLIAAEADPEQGFDWRTSGARPDGATPIIPMRMPTSPDRVVVLTPMPFDTHPVFTDARVDLQIRYRGTAADEPDVREVWAMRGAVRAVLARRFPVRLPTGIYISQCVFAYGTSMGLDAAQQRWEWADSYRTRASETHTVPA